MNTAEQILLKVLNEHGDFINASDEFNENQLPCIIDAMERYKTQALLMDNVGKRYTAQDIDNAYDKGLKDARQIDF